MCHVAEAECIVNLLIHALARLPEDRLAENALVLASALTKVRDEALRLTTHIFGIDNQMDCCTHLLGSIGAPMTVIKIKQT